MSFRIDTRLGTYDAVANGPFRDIMDAVRAIVTEIHPDAVEVASEKEGSVWWGVAPAKMKAGYAYVLPHKAHVNLGFFQGVSLPDPEHRLEGTGKSLRHVKLQDPGAVGDPAIRALIQAAKSERNRAWEK